MIQIVFFRAKIFFQCDFIQLKKGEISNAFSPKNNDRRELPYIPHFLFELTFNLEIEQK